jgi:UDP-N-acetyl-2-amino-2-deoxyglucuronate dehydrogenase
MINTDSTPISISIIGCGRIAGHHCKNIVATPGLKLAGVCDLDVEKARNYGTHYGVPFYSDYHEMLTRHPEIQVVVVATPSGMHFEHVSEVITLFRKHVVVEKPAFLRLADLEQAFDLAARTGVRIFPVFQNRYNRAVVRVKEAIESGELGAIRVAAVRVRWCRPQRYYDMSPWRGTYSQDGGALTNQGVHHVDLLRYLGGEVESVNCSMSTLGASIEVEDTAVANFRFSSGACGVLEVTTAARPKDYEASLSFVCENGLAQLGGIAVNELQVFSPDESVCASVSEDFSGCVYGNGHAVLYQSVLATLADGEEYLVSQHDLGRTLRLLHSFYRSSELARAVQVADAGESIRLGEPNEKLAALYRCPLASALVANNG